MGTLGNNNIVVFNLVTKNIVPFTRTSIGEIILNSTDSRDNDEDCIVTVWENLHLYYKTRGKKFND